MKKLMILQTWIGGSGYVRWKVWVWNWDETTEYFIVERLPRSGGNLIIGVPREHLKEVKASAGAGR